MKQLKINYLLSPLLCIFLFFLFSCNEKGSRINKVEEDIRAKELILKELEIEAKNREIENLKTKIENETYSLAHIYKDVKSSILLIVTENESAYSLGSAFIISPNGVALTNYHVLSGANNMILMNEKKELFYIEDILDADEDLDYVIFKIKTSVPLPYLEIANITSEIGDECFAIGNPKGFQFTLSKGIISSYRNDDKMIQTTAEITHGSSGGALFNKYGKVIGVTTSGMGEANLNFAININAIPYQGYLGNRLDNQLLLSHDADPNHQIKKLINNYYSYIEGNNYSELEDILNSHFTRYFSKYNLKKSEVIKMIKSYDKLFGVISKNAKVRWDTFKIVELENKNFKVTFTLDYSLDRVNKEKVSDFVIDTYIEVTKDYKICSIHEDIISRKKPQ